MLNFMTYYCWMAHPAVQSATCCREACVLPALVPDNVLPLSPHRRARASTRTRCNAGFPQVLRRVAAVDAAALGPHLSDIVPLVTALASGGAGPTRLAAERALTAALRLNVDVAIAQARPPCCADVTCPCCPLTAPSGPCGLRGQT